MDSAASAASSTSETDVPAVRRRRTRPPVARRAGFQLLAGVLIVGVIPVFSTVRILEGNALRNERAHADSALRAEVENGLRQLGTLGNDASTRAADLARSPVVQRAFIAKRRDALTRLARENPGVAFYLGQTRISGSAPTTAAVQPIWLTVNGVRVGKVVVGVPLGAGLAARLTRNAPHAGSDRLLITTGGKIVSTKQKFVVNGRTVTVGSRRYRAVAAAIPDAAGVRLLGLRPEHAIDATVAPYRQRIRYAALGSFALLVLVALMFAGPLLRMLGDFRRVASQATTDALTGVANRRSSTRSSRSSGDAPTGSATRSRSCWSTSTTSRR